MELVSETPPITRSDDRRHWPSRCSSQRAACPTLGCGAASNSSRAHKDRSPTMPQQPNIVGRVVDWIRSWFLPSEEEENQQQFGEQEFEEAQEQRLAEGADERQEQKVRTIQPDLPETERHCTGPTPSGRDSRRAAKSRMNIGNRGSWPCKRSCPLHSSLDSCSHRSSSGRAIIHPSIPNV